MESDRWQNCFILHSRPYEDNGAIVDAFSAECGRFSLLAKGARRVNHPWRALLAPFVPLQIMWRKSASWCKLTKVESVGGRYLFDYSRLVCAMYLNELLDRLLVVSEGSSRLFAAYVQSLQRLAEGGDSVEIVLREFERVLLEEIGYGIDFRYASDRVAITSDQYYFFHFHQGFKLAGSVGREPWARAYLGAILLKINNHDWDSETLACARRLFSSCLGELLGPRPLMSRQLYRRSTRV